jgi:ferredoxin
MTIITLQREKCIGCNYCSETAPQRWAMSQKDGKCVLVGSVAKKGFYTAKGHDDEFEINRLAASKCPVKIIRVVKV